MKMFPITAKSETTRACMQLRHEFKMVFASLAVITKTSGIELAAMARLLFEPIHAHTKYFNLFSPNPQLRKVFRPSGHYFLDIAHHVLGL